MAAFPSMLEYQEAIQNPNICFDDRELKEGTVVLDALGLPKPISGGFASVYQVQTKKKHFAVRCFLRPAATIADRYARISEFQRKHKPEWMADFVYLAQGIKVKGKWYPILKMEWVKGEQLNLHVEKLVGNKKGLENLIQSFIDLLQSMDDLGVAHGDLQHGNILVANGVLKLIDYDAMFIPGMSGNSSEVGHRNFQHPKRSEKDFGPTTDAFSAWVILLALRALQHAPKLWRDLGAGDEGILFRKEDFIDPATSKCIREIEKIRDSEVSTILGIFRKALTSAPNAVVSPIRMNQQNPAQVASAPASSNNHGQASLALVTAKSSSSNHQGNSSSLAFERSTGLIAALSIVGLGSATWLEKIPLEWAEIGFVAVSILTMLILRIAFSFEPAAVQARALRTELGDVSDKLAQCISRVQALTEIESSFAHSRRLDFEVLAARLKTREGHALLQDLSDFLESHLISQVANSGIQPLVSQRLERAGMKNASRFQDVIVSRSLADGNAPESVTVLLRNGRTIEEPTLTRPDAEALLTWRGSLDRSFVTKAQSLEVANKIDLERRQRSIESSLKAFADTTYFNYLRRVAGI